MRWHGVVTFESCPYCSERHYVTAEEGMYNEAKAAKRNIELNLPFTITVPMEKTVGVEKKNIWAAVASGEVFVINCPRCHRNYVIAMYLKNAGKFDRYNEMHRFYPGMQRPNPILTFHALPVATFLEAINDIPNAFTKQKIYRELTMRGIRLNAVPNS